MKINDCNFCKVRKYIAYIKISKQYLGCASEVTRQIKCCNCGDYVQSNTKSREELITEWNERNHE